MGITLGIKEERTTEGIIVGPCYCRCMWGSIELFLTLMAAAATALLLGLFAHDALGMPIDTIRIDAPAPPA